MAVLVQEAVEGVVGIVDRPISREPAGLAVYLAAGLVEAMAAAMRGMAVGQVTPAQVAPDSSASNFKETT